MAKTDKVENKDQKIAISSKKNNKSSYSKKKKITAAVTHELSQVGSDFTQKYIVGSKRLGGFGRRAVSGAGKKSSELNGKKNKPRLSSSGAALDEYGYPLQWEGSVY